MGHPGVALLDMANGSGFFWKNWPATIPYGTYDTNATFRYSLPYSDYTWAAVYKSPVTTSDYTHTTGGVQFGIVGSGDVYSKRTVNITLNNGIYTGEIGGLTYLQNIYYVSGSVYWDTAPFEYKNGQPHAGWMDDDTSGWDYSSNSYSSSDFFTTLEYFCRRFRNINVTYNGEPYNPSEYDWQPVPSVQGNGKIYNFSQINSSAINDGDPVTAATITSFSILNEVTRLDKLVDDVNIDKTKVSVNYNIPSGDYKFVKLVYKQDEIPITYKDGTAINITQASTSCVIDGIADGNTYWFKIFTDVSESEPRQFKTTKFSDTYDLNNLVKTNTINNHQDYMTSSIDVTSVNNLSSYFGTNNILRITHSSWQASYIRQFDGFTASCDATNALVYTYSYLPITRNKVISIKLKMRIASQSGQQNAYIGIQTCYYSGNTMIVNNGIVEWDRTSTSNWKDYTLAYTKPVDADYIQIRTGYNDWYIKDVIIEVVI